MSEGSRVALVTGCGRRAGVGAAVARRLAADGFDVAITDVSDQPTSTDAALGWSGLKSLADDVEALGRRTCLVVGDIASTRDCLRMMETVEQDLGPVGVLVNNAAAPHGADRDWFWNVPDDALERVLDINVAGTFRLTRAMVQSWFGQDEPHDGRIINVASIAGIHGLPRRAAYSASKAAIISLTQAMAKELGPHGLTVNAVAPGAVETSRREGSTSTSNDPAAHIYADAPVGRIGQPGDVASAVAYLARPDSGFVNGHTLTVSGGA